MVLGVSHITFIVTDLERTANFLAAIFEAKEVYSSTTAKYFLINDLWVALNKGDTTATRTYNHLAFTICESDFDKYVERIKTTGVEIIQGRTRKEGEGQSVYFYDFDNNLFELHTGSLSERLNHYTTAN